MQLRFMLHPIQVCTPKFAADVHSKIINKILAGRWDFVDTRESTYWHLELAGISLLHEFTVFLFCFVFFQEIYVCKDDNISAPLKLISLNNKCKGKKEKKHFLEDILTKKLHNSSSKKVGWLCKMQIKTECNDMQTS